MRGPSIFSVLGAFIMVVGTVTAADAAAEVKKDVSISCLIYDDLSFYDLRAIQSQSRDYLVEKGDEKYYFNLCGQSIESCKPDSTEIFAYKKAADGTCTELTNLKVATSKVVTDKGGKRKVQLKFGQPKNKCIPDPAKPETATNYQLTVNLYCNSDSDATVSFKDLIVDNSNPCEPVITGTHVKACSLISVTKFTRYFVSNPAILGVIAIAFGLIVAFQGRKFFEYTIFALGSIVGFCITMLLFQFLSMLSSQQGSELTFLGTLFSFAFSFAMAAFLGYILYRMLDIGAAIMGAISGVFLALTINQVLFFWVDGQASEIIFWTLALLLGGYLAYLSKVQYHNIVIFGTAVLGAYSTVRGLSLFFPGTFPPETEIFKQIADDTIDPLFYSYVAAFIITSIIGALYQKRQKDMYDKTNIRKN